MILYLLENFFSGYNSLNIFNYLTVRSAFAVLTSLFICLFFGPKFILYMEKKQKKGQPIRKDGPPSHLLTKVGTPTMGGLLIIFSLISSSFIWSDLSNAFIWIVLYSTLGFGALGFADDYIKIMENYDLMQTILNKMEEESKKHDIQSTPTFIINDSTPTYLT